MTKVNGVNFRKNMLPASKYSLKAPFWMSPKKITLHETDNVATAWNEIAYMIGNNSVTGYHVAVDEKEVVQGIPFNRNAYHSGDGINGYGNRNTIAVEICKNYDRKRKTTDLVEPLKSQHAKAESNAIKYVAQLCIDQGIVANNANIKTHNDWSGKWCPRKILNEKRLQAVKSEIIKEYNRLTRGGYKEGWIRDNTGWWYQESDGGYPRGQWRRVSGVWYLFDSRGYMLTGWQKVKDTWYYLHSNGAMRTGWQKIDDKWYYFRSNGAMSTGWVKVKSEWYYMDESGAMVTGWRKIKGKRYYMSSSGAMVKGLTKIGSKYYFFENSGAMIENSEIALEANSKEHLE